MYRTAILAPCMALAACTGTGDDHDHTEHIHWGDPIMLAAYATVLTTLVALFVWWVKWKCKSKKDVDV